MLWIHLIILGALFAVSALVLLLICSEVGARAERATDDWAPGEPTAADILDSWGVDVPLTWLAGVGARDED